MERPDYRTSRRERAVRVYTVCDESRYLIVKNVPALGCIDELVKLFGLYGDIEEYRLLDEEECEPYTDVYWIKYSKISNSRFAKRKLDEYRFLGNLLDVSYAPNSETLADTKDKLEERRRTVLNRIRGNQQQGERPSHGKRSDSVQEDPLVVRMRHPHEAQQYPPFPLERLPYKTIGKLGNVVDNPVTVQPNERVVMEDTRTSQYFPTKSMNATVQTVRETLAKISSMNAGPSPASQASTGSPTVAIVEANEGKGKRAAEGEDSSVMKKRRQDNRRRI